MYFFHNRLIMFLLAVLLLLSIFNVNPFIVVSLLTLSYIITIGYKHENSINYSQKAANLPSLDHSTEPLREVYSVEKQSKAFIELIPVVSYPQKKIVFYHCRLYHPHHLLNGIKNNNLNHHLSFFECLKFLSNHQKIDKNVRYILDLNSFILSDETYFDLFLYHLQQHNFKKDHVIFSVEYKTMQEHFYKMKDLCKFDLNFNVYNIPVDQIENFLTGEFGPFIYSCQVSQSQLINLMRDELMNEKMHSFHGYMARLMVSDIEDPEDIKALPNIVDYVCGKGFAKSLTVAV